MPVCGCRLGVGFGGLRWAVSGGVGCGCTTSFVVAALSRCPFLESYFCALGHTSGVTLRDILGQVMSETGGTVFSESALHERRELATEASHSEALHGLSGQLKLAQEKHQVHSSSSSTCT